MKNVENPLNKNFLSIKYLLESKKYISINDLRNIFNSMIKTIELPNIDSELPSQVRYRDTIEIKIKNHPIPLINLYDGIVETVKSSRQVAPVFASFNGKNSPLIVELKQKLVNKSYELEVPDGALSGPVVMFFPFQIKYGIDIQSKVKEFRNTMLPCPEGFTANIDTTIIRYLPVIILPFLNTSCGLCINQEISICPYGAIKFNPEGQCYIDQSICKGQWCELSNSGNPRDRLTEHKCWECFNSSEQFSDKCSKHLISRVLFIDSPCCGCCGPFATEIPGICLRELCKFDAIEGGNGLEGNRCGQVYTGDGSWGGSYRVDQKKCIGCMMCYLNINCQNVMMKAFIQPRYENKVLIKSIEFIPNKNYKIPILNKPLKIFLGVFGQNSSSVFFDKIPLNTSLIMQTMVLNKKYRFIENLYLAIYFKDRDRLIPLLMMENLHDFINDFTPNFGIISANTQFSIRIDRVVMIRARPYGLFKITFDYIGLFNKN